ncbi:MAG: hypothetical protein ACR2J9_00925, partial [Gaiellales bacterium]
APLQWRAEAGAALQFHAQPWQASAPSDAPQELTVELAGLPVGKAVDLRIATTDGVTTTNAEPTQLPQPAKPAPIGGVHLHGAATAGRAVRCELGRWSGTRPFAVAWQWLLDGRAIAGATQRAFTPADAQTGRSLACRVTVSGPGGVTQRTTARVVVA